MSLRPAAEFGFQGVACVDDAARLASLYLAIWRNHRVKWARRGARETLAFVRAMQTPEGWFVNFLNDWDGTKNLAGPTSAQPTGPWLARACHALAAGAGAFSDEACESALDRALPWLELATPYLDVRAVSLLAALESCRGAGQSGRPGHSRRAVRWAEEIYDARLEGIVPDVRGSPSTSGDTSRSVRSPRPSWCSRGRHPALQRSRSTR